MLDCSPPTAIATNWPGRKRSATPGATSVIVWYVPMRRVVSTVPGTCTGDESVTRLLRSTTPPEVLGVLLQRPHADVAGGDRLDALDRRAERLHRGEARNAAEDRGGADLVSVEPRPGLPRAAERGVDDEVDLAVEDAPYDRRLAIRPWPGTVLPDDLGTDAVAPQDFGGALGRQNLKT